jgi:Zn-dependent protease with chaperone function
MPPPPQESAIVMRRNREWAMGTGSARADTRSADSAARIRSISGIASLALLALPLAAGCWTRKAEEIMRPDPTPPSGFLEEHEHLEDTGGRAFQRAWVEPGFWFDRYESIQVAPVDVSHLLAMSGWEKAGLHRGDVEQEAQELAAEMREKFAQALREQPDARLRVVQEPTPETAILELEPALYGPGGAPAGCADGTRLGSVRRQPGRADPAAERRGGDLVRARPSDHRRVGGAVRRDRERSARSRGLRRLLLHARALVKRPPDGVCVRSLPSRVRSPKPGLDLAPGLGHRPGAPHPRGRGKPRAHMSIETNGIRSVAALFASAFLLHGCVTSARIAELGAEEAKKVEQSMGIVRDAELERYVAAIGRKLAASSDRPAGPWRFQIVDTAEPNAFALPGGYVYVSRGLLALVNSEDELAGVIGHEIGHVTAAHAEKRIRASVATSPVAIATGLAGFATSIVSPSLGRMVASSGQLITSGFVIAPYGRSQENEADAIGQALAAKTGYDPAGIAQFLHTLDREMTLLTGEERRPSFLDTHPMTADRVSKTAQRANTLTRLPGSPVARDQADVFARIEGIVVGHDPAQGVFRENVFLHPELEPFRSGGSQ